MGPVMEGAGLNITVMSYRGSVDFGFMVDRDLVPDVWDMADHVQDALVELQETAGIGPVAEAPAKKPARKAPTPRKTPTARKPPAARKAPAARKRTPKKALA